MDVALNTGIASRYTSGSQRARVMTEFWAVNNLYCPACTCQRIEGIPINSEAADFRCPDCASLYQLKATKRPIGSRITDAGYDAMMRAVSEDRFPNLLVMRYDLQAASVRDLLLVPSFVLPVSAVVARKPLGPMARRAGWIGCNIALDAVPADGRIAIIEDSEALPIVSVRKKYSSLLVLKDIPVIKRGWVLDVLRIVTTIGDRVFSLQDIYAFEQRLSELHPQNHHVRPKIRQQLQVLRDLGLVSFVEKGTYRLRKEARA